MCEGRSSKINKGLIKISSMKSQISDMRSKFSNLYMKKMEKVQGKNNYYTWKNPKKSQVLTFVPKFINNGDTLWGSFIQAGNKAWARSLVRQSDGLLIRRPGVQIPSGPLIYFLFWRVFYQNYFFDRKPRFYFRLSFCVFLPIFSFIFLCIFAYLFVNPLSVFFLQLPPQKTFLRKNQSEI